MEDEISEQPEQLARNAERYAGELRFALKDRKFDMALLVARGSSDNAALYGRYLIEIHLRIPVSLAAPSVLTRYGSEVRYSNCLAVGISQSGAAPDVAEVLQAVGSQGHATLAITNTPGSLVTQCAAHTLLLQTGPEKSVAATKTYTSSLLALYELVRALGGDLPYSGDALPTDSWSADCRLQADSGLGYILRSGVLFALARGYSFSSAQETALKLMECALLPCKSYSSADFQHGPKALAGSNSAAIVYGDPIDGLADQGCALVSAPSMPERVPEPLRPLWEVFFGQWLALLAARARAFDPDEPRFIQKVTETR